MFFLSYFTKNTHITGNIVLYFDYDINCVKMTKVEGCENVAKKRKLRKDRVAIAGLLSLLLIFGLYKGVSWTLNHILFKEKPKEETVEKKERTYLATVILDPGHGGYDAGANRNNLFEKDISLVTAKAVGEALDKEDIKVIYTREEDKALHATKIGDLRLRANMAKENNADYFVSIHVNDFDDSRVSGFEVYTKNEQSKTLGENILNSIDELQYINNRGIQDGKSLMVLRENTVPSVLVEIGYIKGDDYEYLKDNEKLANIGRAIADGIVKQIKN